MSADLLSNMLSSIKNASMAGNSSLELPHSNECEAVAKVLKQSGFVADVKKFKPKGKSHKMLHIDVAYDKMGLPVVTKLQRVSKPGRRVYEKSEDIKKVQSGYGVMVISTSRGVMAGDEAKKKKLGGEIICKVW